MINAKSNQITKSIFLFLNERNSPLSFTVTQFFFTNSLQPPRRILTFDLVSLIAIKVMVVLLIVVLRTTRAAQRQLVNFNYCPACIIQAIIFLMNLHWNSEQYACIWFAICCIDVHSEHMLSVSIQSGVFLMKLLH